MLRDLIREMIKVLPDNFFYDDWEMEIVEEIYRRVKGLDEPEKHIKACIDYMLDMGDGDPIGFDLLLNEEDDCVIWGYI